MSVRRMVRVLKIKLLIAVIVGLIAGFFGWALIEMIRADTEPLIEPGKKIECFPECFKGSDIQKGK